MNRLIKVLLLALPMLQVGALLAAPITNDIGLVEPNNTVTFDEQVFSQGTEITDQFAPWGVRFESLLYYDSQGPGPWGFSGVETHYVGNSGEARINPFSIFFTQPQTAAAFGIATNTVTTTFTAKLGGAIVESYQSNTDYDDASISFQGFEGIKFDEIEIIVGGDGAAIIDNVQLVAAAQSIPVPINATWAIGILILLVTSYGFVMNKGRRE